MRKTIKKIMSSALSVVLAFGVCVPMASIAPMAYAADAYPGGDSEQETTPGNTIENTRTVDISVRGGNGTTAPAPGSYQIEKGIPQQIVFQPSAGYVPSKIYVNGSEQAVASETSVWMIPASFSDQTFEVEFAPSELADEPAPPSMETRTVTPSVRGNIGGMIMPNTPAHIKVGETTTYAIVPSEGYILSKVYVDGVEYPATPEGMAFVVPASSSDQMLEVEFVPGTSSVSTTPGILLNTPDGVKPGTEYEVYRVFNANVLDKEVAEDKNITNAVVTANKYITDIEFADGVEGLFDLAEGETAFNAAIALKDALHGDDAVAQGIAWAQKLDAQHVGTITAGGESLEVGSTGYYLIVNKNEVNSIENAVSYPIFVAVGNETVEITEKSSIPYITKYVKEDSNGKWQKYADFAKKDIQEFKFEITMPNNIAQYTNYEIGIDDETLHYMAMESITVSIDGTEIHQEIGTATPMNPDSEPIINYTYSDGDFTFADIKAVAARHGVELTSDSVMTIEYKAFANDLINVPANNEAHTVDPYVNKVRMFYSNNPANDESRGQSVYSATNEYSYGIRVKVEERITDAPLPGFGFTVADSDGNLVADADGNTTWMTNMEGVIELPYLDADDYTITCVEKALGYDADVETFTLKLTPTYDDTLGTLDEFGADVPEGFNAQRRAGVEKADNAWVLADGGYGNVTLSIPSNMNMPITGEGGYALIIAAGLALITVAVVRTYRSRRNTIA